MHAGSTGVTFTRWGHDSCPAVAGTTLVYTGQVAGAYFNQRGGGSNYLCLPKDPEYGSIGVNYIHDFSRIYGTEYELPVAGTHDNDAPCAVCFDSVRSSELMIPAKTSCPTGWTSEYNGYLMAAANFGDRSRAQYVCVDKEQKSLPGSSINYNGALLYHVRATCIGSSIPCPPYNDKRALTCVVCTRWEHALLKFQQWRPIGVTISIVVVRDLV